MNWLVKSSIAGAVAIFGSIPSTAQQSRPAQVAPAYQIRPGDMLLISVRGQEQLFGQILVNREGNIILPVVGDIAAWGLTTEGLASAIRDRVSAQTAANPQVVVTVLRMVNGREPMPRKVMPRLILNGSPPVPNAPRPPVSGRA